MTERVEMVVPEALAGERLDRALATVTGRTRTAVAEAVARGAVAVDGRTATTRSTRLAAGSVVVADLAEPAGPAAVEPEAGVEVAVVHADDDIVVVDKPPGLVVHPGSGVTGGTLVAGLLARYPAMAGAGDPARPGIVHRLDKGTSGLLVAAVTREAHAGLVAQLAAREVERLYLALVWGRPEAPAGLVDAPIGRAARDRTRMAVAGGGREARTRYQVRRGWADPEVALLECRLETGRTHQIRVHLSAIGHPVVGDDRYGGRRRGLAAPRPMLHAARLGFRHPRTGAPLQFESPLPPDFEEVLAALDG